MLSSLDKFSSNLNKDKFRKTREYLESLYVQQPNQAQTNNVTEGGEEGKAMHAHADYWNDPYKLPTLTSDQQQQIEEESALMTRKEVYPYEYMDTFEPSFYNSLTEEDISKIDYTQAQRVFNHFDMADLEDYCNFYLLTDVLQLADVFENFRDVCLQYYGLDPAYNYTSPGLPWEAALKMTVLELELLTDIDQNLFIEEGIMGQMAMINHQHAPGMENYNLYIKYLDANNLYGWGISQPLPTSRFKMWRWYLIIVQGDIFRSVILVSIVSTISIFMNIS